MRLFFETIVPMLGFSVGMYLADKMSRVTSTAGFARAEPAGNLTRERDVGVRVLKEVGKEVADVVETSKLDKPEDEDKSLLGGDCTRPTELSAGSWGAATSRVLGTVVAQAKG